MNFFGKAKKLIIRPQEFFSDLTHEKKIYPAILFALFFHVYYLAISILLIYVSGFATVGFPGGENLDWMKIMLRSLISWVGLFVHAGIAHLWIHLFRGKGNYIKTYQLVVYSITPSYLYGWIPYVGVIIGFIHSIVLAIIGVQKTHGLSRKNAIISNLIPVGLGIVLLIFIAWMLEQSGA